ncbi:glycerol-3-phosphate 1-O-acyltransferase PlsY [[Haemophilus] ducreyi]|uniref:glycerol-3-phosphate 1-O-acyltransferase PlsY n=1 Tax=Haemophilus ducreyi TaxID=730 RepID=UPI0006565696|nr:glycerol-3-phosphate 1-O-acyltransferase PlsY [[Haemophilus] ducreyi]AKO45320.1 glycerol-3-phosphate acyltransferase [[Haemophilus] ducreyi]AKO46705.1 glycerol-3-phosphate acyltransferase [[Haemophilus] ducreyi]AKO48046.1 glycerol-3-phosphate acyltransferase [[Haemophilus] ducreyi]AKO49433.1 glycerol-3-phosphate acyltransferase [[Haemophilus] ducreyi]ANF61529.1 glycerol-3-phosphate acyltransferase [[Haemophilus] ducreyi]
MTLTAYLLILTAYLLGSICSAIIFCRLAGLPDPRQNGSHNPGATNVLRNGGKLAAIGVLLFDTLKGSLPVLIAFRCDLSPSAIGLIGLAACLGHIFPIFFQFRGGKGVATAFGVFFPISIVASTTMICTWLIIFLLTRFSSLSAVIMALTAPFYIWCFKPEFTFPVALICCLLIYRHHDNIQRLWRGQEERLWDKLRSK